MASKKTSDNPAKGVKWDLLELYSGMDDPQIEKDKKKIQNAVSKFTETYKGKINSKDITSSLLLQSLREYSKLVRIIANTVIYSDLLYVTDTTNEQKQSFNQSMHEFTKTIETSLVWYSLELIALSENMFLKLLTDTNLQEYEYYLRHTRSLKPHTLSEAEEKLLLTTSQSGREAFERIYDETRAKIEVKITVDGKRITVPISATSKYSHSKDRKVRKSVSVALTKKAKENKDFFKFVYNTILLDYKISNDIKNFSYPYQAALLNDGIEKEMVDSMTEAVWKRTEIVQRFYNAKKSLLGYKKLYRWDMYAPIFDTKSSFSWNESKRIVINGINKASPKLAAIAKQIIDNDHIDAEISKGKIGGGFCAYFSSDHLPYILMNFDGQIRSVSTLAHELGHGFHGVLSHKHNNIINADTPLPIAEIASVFTESIVTDKLLERITDTTSKMEFLNQKIIESFGTVFIQTAYFLFEQAVHTHRKERGELSLKELYSYWNKQFDHLYGNVIEKGKDRGHGWMYIPHFHHTPFYVYSYAFGELLSQALYAKYKQEGKAFMDNYIEALKAGGSKSPAEITAMMGVDITDPKFWDNGLDLLEGYVDEFEQLAAEV